MEEAQIRIQQMEEEKGFKVDKKEIPQPQTEPTVEDEFNIDDTIGEKNVVYIDKNELKDSPQNILNIENSVVYISSSSRAPSPSHQEHQEEGHGPPSLGTQSLKSQDDHINNMLVYNLKK